MHDVEEAIRAGKVDTLVVWRLDRLGRTAGQTINFLDDLAVAGVRFVSVRDAVDTSTASGRLLRTILAGFAEYEREVISERVKAGIRRAKAAGKTWGGRKRGDRYKLTSEKLKALRALMASGATKAAAARQLGVSRSSVYRGQEALDN